MHDHSPNGHIEKTDFLRGGGPHRGHPNRNQLRNATVRNVERIERSKANKTNSYKRDKEKIGRDGCIKLARNSAGLRKINEIIKHKEKGNTGLHDNCLNLARDKSTVIHKFAGPNPHNRMVEREFRVKGGNEEGQSSKRIRDKKFSSPRSPEARRKRNQKYKQKFKEGRKFFNANTKSTFTESRKDLTYTRDQETPSRNITFPEDNGGGIMKFMNKDDKIIKFSKGKS